MRVLRGAGLDFNGVQNLLRRCPRYELKRILGSGSFGTVAEVFDVYKRRSMAIKFIAGGPTARHLEREVLNHRALHHPNIIQYKEVFSVRRYLAILMEYANGGDLIHLIGKKTRLQENEARSIFQQLILAVDYCHRKKISLRDIKCDNLLLHYRADHAELPVAKLCDFGLSCRKSVQTDPQSIVGSKDYMPPEVILNDQRDVYDAEKFDIWSCGIVLYVMLVGKYPFSPSNMSYADERYDEILRENVRDLNFEIPDYVSESAKALIECILCSAEDRFSIEMILKHPWFQTRLSPDALRLNNQILEKEEENMRKLESYQSERTVRNIIRKVYLGDDSAATMDILDESFSKLFEKETFTKEREIQLKPLPPSPLLISPPASETIKAVPVREVPERKPSCVKTFFWFFNWI